MSHATPETYNALVDRILAGTKYTHIDDFLAGVKAMEIEAYQLARCAEKLAFDRENFRAENAALKRTDVIDLLQANRELTAELADAQAAVQQNYSEVCKRHAEIERLEAENAALSAWIERAFLAHPNIDLDIVAIEGETK